MAMCSQHLWLRQYDLGQLQMGGDVFVLLLYTHHCILGVCTQQIMFAKLDSMQT